MNKVSQEIPAAVGHHEVRGAANQTPVAGLQPYVKFSTAEQHDPHLPYGAFAEMLGLESPFVTEKAKPAGINWKALLPTCLR